MTEPRVTVGIPVGPSADACRWLPEALDSVRAQTVPVRIIVVDDMHGGLLVHDHNHEMGKYGKDVFFEHQYVYYAPWNLGVAQAFNHCVALAPTDLVFMMGADDTLEPECIERCLEAFDREIVDQELGYYWVPIRYMDTGEVQGLPCNAAMVHKNMWKATGGFPPETASGAPDAAFISRIIGTPGFPAHLVQVGNVPLYNYRRHDATDTAGRQPWQGVILTTRDILTKRWQKPEWGRYD